MRIIALQWRAVKSTLEECKTHIDMQHTNHELKDIYYTLTVTVRVILLVNKR